MTKKSETNPTTSPETEIVWGEEDSVAPPVKMLTQEQAKNYVFNSNYQAMTNINSNININEFVRESLKQSSGDKDDFWKRIRIEISLNIVNPERFYLYVKSLVWITVVCFLFFKVKFPDLEFKKEDLEKYLRVIYHAEEGKTLTTTTEPISVVDSVSPQIETSSQK